MAEQGGDRWSMEPIATLHSPFRDKFGVPRQPGLVRSIQATVELLPPCNRPEAVRGLEEFSHIWLIYLFDRIAAGSWKPTVRPPRLGGNQRIGVFASRSNFRPNPVGLSLVELLDIEYDKGRILLRIGAPDLLDATPILDIKPYLPWADSVSGATAGYAPDPPTARVPEVIGRPVAEKLEQLEEAGRPRLRESIEALLALDPRPAYRRNERGIRHVITLYDLEIEWHANGESITITGVHQAST